jgi:Mg-chelatase subunit ChlD
MGAFGFEGSRERLRKKKDLTPDLEEDEAARTQSQFQSAFKQPSFSYKQAMFLPPEAFGNAVSADETELMMELASASAWDVATRYHEFKSMASMKKRVGQLRKLSAQAILERAQEILGSVVHPVEQRSAPWKDVPPSALQTDIDLDETLENSPLALSDPNYPVTDEDIWMSFNVHRRQAVVLTVDTSLSMTGEKLALTAVALAVVLLQFPEDPVGIVAFENEATVLKRPEERISIDQLVERFLDVPAQGYTHLEDGMKAALKLVRATREGSLARIPSTVLLSDGKYTAGRDPSYLAPRFPHLVVIKMGKERASLELCREMAQRGNGALREVGELEELPLAMYSVVKDLLRGRSLA